MAMDCAFQRSSESCSGSPAPSPATWAFLLHLQEATGDSECHDDLPAADDVAFDADDDADAESCSGGGDDLCVELDSRRRLWERCWMMETANGVVLADEAACPTLKVEDTAAAADADSDRLFWEACIAHGY